MTDPPPSVQLQPIEQLLSQSEQLSRAIEAYVNKDFDSAEMRAEAILRTAPKDSQLSVLARFFHLHFDAYAIWDGTYDYSRICGKLTDSAQALKANQGQFLPEDSPYVDALCTLSRVVASSTRYENSLITNDPLQMAEAAAAIVREAEAGMKSLDQIPDWPEKRLAALLHRQFKHRKTMHEAVLAYARLMSLKDEDRLRFLKGYPEAIAAMRSGLENLVAAGDFELSSELRAHCLFLERQHELVVQSKGKLRLRNVDLHLILGMLLDEEQCGVIYENLKSADAAQVQERFRAAGIPLAIESVLEEEPSDLLAQSYEFELRADCAQLAPNSGASCRPGRLDNLMLHFGSAEVKLIDRTYEAEVFARLHRFGVCNLILKFSIDECSASRLRVLQSAIGPHIGQLLIRWQGREFLYLARLEPGQDWNESLGYFISSRVRTVLAQYATANTIAWYYHPNLNWFSCAYVRDVEFAGPNGLAQRVNDARLLARHPEYKALFLGPREARATLDDWVGVPLTEADSVNLATIRSHESDLLVMDENHALLYFPDDPEFVVFTYLQSIELVSSLRTVANCLNKDLDRRLEEARIDSRRIAASLGGKDINQLEEDLRSAEDFAVGIDRFEVEAESMVQLIRAPTLSQYRDHARLMEALINRTMIPASLELIDRKLGLVRDVQSSLNRVAANVLEDMKRDREKAERERRRKEFERLERLGNYAKLLNLVVTTLAIASLIDKVEEAIQDPLGFGGVKLVVIVGLTVAVLILFRRLTRSSPLDQAAEAGADVVLTLRKAARRRGDR